MNEHERQRIAAAMNHLRPDWPVKQLTTLLGHPGLVERPRRDVTVALSWIACESGTANPYRVLEAGPWWRAAGVETGGSAPRPPKPSEACRTCGRHASTCACDDGPRTRPLPKSPDTSQRVAELRAAATQPTDRPTTTAREGLRGAHRE